MKRTKMIAWIMMLVLLLGSIAIPAGAEGEMKLLSIVAVEGETIWMHTSHGLAPFDKDGWQIGEALYPGMDCYAIGPDGHIYYSIDGDIFAMDRDGNEIDRWQTPIDNFTKILVNETYIIIMGEEEYGAIHMADHIMRSGIVTGIKDIGFYNADSFVLIQDMGALQLLVQIDCNTLTDGAIEQLFFECSLASGSEAEGFYLYDEKAVHYLPEFGEEIFDHMKFPADVHIHDALLAADTIYAITDTGLKTYERKADTTVKKVLTIYNGLIYQNDDRIEKAIEIFAQRRPEYTVRLTDSVLRSKMNTELLANEPGYDILVLGNGGHNLPVYKNAGIFAELSGNTAITESIAQYMEMPFLWENDGRLYGVPIMVVPIGFMINKTLLDMTGAEIDKDWTWEDLRLLADAAKEMGMKLVEESPNGWGVVMEQYEAAYCDFLAGTAEYDTDTLRNLLTLWKEFQAEGLLADPFEMETTLLECDLMPVVSNPEWWKNKTYLGMPTIDGECVTPIYMDALYANRNSEHADAAIEFLEIFASVEVQKEKFMPEILPDLQMHTQYPIWEMNNEIPTQEQMELHQHFLRTGVLIERNSDFATAKGELLGKLWADDLTVDEFVAELQERADLMIGE